MYDFRKNGFRKKRFFNRHVLSNNSVDAIIDMTKAPQQTCTVRPENTAKDKQEIAVIDFLW